MSCCYPQPKSVTKMVFNPQAFINSLSMFNQQIDQGSQNKQQKINAMFQKLHDIIEELQHLREAQIIQQQNRNNDFQICSTYSILIPPTRRNYLKQQIQNQYLFNQCREQQSSKLSNSGFKLSSEYYTEPNRQPDHLVTETQNFYTENSRKVPQTNNLIIKLRSKKMLSSHKKNLEEGAPSQRTRNSQIIHFGSIHLNQSQIRTFR